MHDYRARPAVELVSIGSSAIAQIHITATSLDLAEGANASITNIARTDPTL